MDTYLIIIFIAYICVVFAGYWLDYLNLSHLKKRGNKIPPDFEGHIDQELLNKTQRYVIENTKFDFFSSLFHNVILLIFLFGGLLNIYNSWISSLKMPFIVSGLIFFLILLYADTIIMIPFKWYHTFVIENKYGFTTSTMKLWLTDLWKSLLITTIIISLIISIGFLIVQVSPNFWWFWIWCFFLCVSVLMMYVFPYVIAPLFNKFTPVEDESLQERIRGLMQKVGITVKSVFTMDASKRTKHTNAYFTGIGKVKRIVLYDTLLEKMDKDEILSVLAHEAGHWKKKHLLKHLIVSEIFAIIVMFVSFKIVQTEGLIHLFNLKESTFFSKIVLIGFLGSIVSFPFTPFPLYFSRKHEYEADTFSYEITKDRKSMISTLVKLSKDNLSNLYPHPLYAAFHYSHPPVLERIKAIKGR
ncbi:MAG: M48 family metallopeptidase [Candidatus Kuenenia sp.]|nr:M48 family metallopeptidase [Candidatus Kuenenia hertensis]